MLEVAYILATSFDCLLVYLIITVQKLTLSMKQKRRLKLHCDGCDLCITPYDILRSMSWQMISQCHRAMMIHLQCCCRFISICFRLNDMRVSWARKLLISCLKHSRLVQVCQLFVLQVNFSKIKRRTLWVNSSSILLGTVSGAALALFLTDKGKQVCSQLKIF